jgi:hypothetical protein
VDNLQPDFYQSEFNLIYASNNIIDRINVSDTAQGRL